MNYGNEKPTALMVKKRSDKTSLVSLKKHPVVAE